MAEEDKIPDYFRKATVEDFHINGEPCLGMKYWLHSHHNPILEQYTLFRNTDSEGLSEWIKSGRCYIEISRHEGVNCTIDLK